jgi:phage baseplate assembly protein W
MSLSMILPIKLFTQGFGSFSDPETKEAIQQNLKMLILTKPEEYPMDIDFGVGITNYLFETHSQTLTEQIRSRILRQATKYMPYISIKEISFDTENVDGNQLGLKIVYIISETDLPQIFDLSVTL